MEERIEGLEGIGEREAEGAPPDGGAGEADRVGGAGDGAGASDWAEGAGEDLIAAREVQRINPDLDWPTILGHVTKWREGRTEFEMDRLRLEYVKSLREQEDAIREGEPEFDLSRAVGESPALRALILAGEPVARALEYAEPERAARRIEREVLERIRRRNARPEPIGAANGAEARFDPAGMTEGELRRLEERVRRGERVAL